MYRYMGNGYVLGLIWHARVYCCALVAELISFTNDVKMAKRQNNVQLQTENYKY